MRRIKFLLGTAALFAGLAMAPAVKAQVSVQIGVPAPDVEVGVPPVCPYGYYETPPYACAPVGFYGPGFFFNGVFLGVGPWAGWGYGHGWGDHRFVDAGGGRYRGRGGYEANHGHWAHGGGHGDHHGEGHGDHHGEGHGGHEGHPGGHPGGGHPGGGHPGGGHPGGEHPIR